MQYTTHVGETDIAALQRTVTLRRPSDILLMTKTNFLVIQQRKILARDWSKLRHVTFTNTHHCPRTVARGNIEVVTAFS